MKYKVLREHLGDRAYGKGDEREADPLAVAHLVTNGVLRQFTEKELADLAAEQEEADRIAAEVAAKVAKDQEDARAADEAARAAERARAEEAAKAAELAKASGKGGKGGDDSNK